MCEHGFIGACAECDGSGQQPEAITCDHCKSPLLPDGSCDFCVRPVAEDSHLPPPGSWADVARIMAASDDSGFNWDAWKDEMKEKDL